MLVQSELAADQIVFGLLRRFERGGRLDEAGARVRHARPEHQAVELVADVVVVADHLGVAAFGVSSAAGGGLLRRGGRGPAEDTQLESGPHGENGRPRPRPQIGPRRAVQCLEHAEDVALCFQFARDVRTADAELAGGPEHPADGVGRSDGEGSRPVGGPDRAPVPELETDRQAVAEEPLEEGGHHRRCASCRLWRATVLGPCHADAEMSRASQFRLHHVGFHGPSFASLRTQRSHVIGPLNGKSHWPVTETRDGSAIRGSGMGQRRADRRCWPAFRRGRVPRATRGAARRPPSSHSRGASGPVRRRRRT